MRSYWWVNQGKAYKIQKDGSFLWSPQTEKDGGYNKGFTNMTNAKIGDVIFVNNNSSIAALAIVTKEALESERPNDFPDDQNPNSSNGWRLEAEYFEFEDDQKKAILPLFELFRDTPAIKSPFGIDKKAKQKVYLNDLRLEDGERLLGIVGEPNRFRSRLNGQPMPDSLHIARITWNDNGWNKPSGSKEDHESEDNFTAQNGYGHEEWLFSRRFIFKGYEYGFIEGAANKRAEDHGNTVDVMLYTVSTSLGWYFVGEIKGCEILTEEVAAEAVEFFKSSGAINKMIADVESVQGNSAFLTTQPAGPRGLFCVRFKPENLFPYETRQLIPLTSFIRGKYNRYQINEINVESFLDELSNYRVKKEIILEGTRIVPAREIELDYLHKKIQIELEVILKKRFKKVEAEYRDIDIFIQDERDYLLEIKTSDTARMCIREAIGQLLEYAFYKWKYNDPHFVIVGPSKMQIEDLDYINKLNQLIGVRIHYCHYELGSKKFEYLF